MARIYEPAPEMEKEWKAWVKSRPAIVRRALRGLNPWTLYRMTDTDQRVTLVSASEDGTVKVFVSSEYNFTMFERNVFGIDPKLLVECELPRPRRDSGRDDVAGSS